jgi:hypothetical protein
MAVPPSLAGSPRRVWSPEKIHRLSFISTLLGYTSWSKIQRSIYWEAGNYSATLVFKTKRPDKEHIFKFTFDLTDQDQKTLEQNAINTLWQSAGIPNIIFNQVEPVIKNFQKM